VATAFPPCGHRACADEVEATGLSGRERAACFREVKASCTAGECSCNGEPPCVCDPVPGGCDCHPAPSPGACALQPGPPGPICGGSCLNGTDQCLFDPATMMCRCVPPTAVCEQQPQSQCAVGLCPSPVGGCQDIGTACACPIP
jgi:hypothetical protein